MNGNPEGKKSAAATRFSGAAAAPVPVLRAIIPPAQPG